MERLIDFMAEHVYEIAVILVLLWLVPGLESIAGFLLGLGCLVFWTVLAVGIVCGPTVGAGAGLVLLLFAAFAVIFRVMEMLFS